MHPSVPYVYICDQRGMDWLAASMNSLRSNWMPQDRVPQVIVVHGGDLTRDEDSLQARFQQSGRKISLQFVEIRDAPQLAKETSLPDHLKHISPAARLKFHLPELFAGTYPWIFYLDIDTHVYGDPATEALAWAAGKEPRPLWMVPNMREPDFSSAYPDPGHPARREAGKNNPPFFNTGVMLMDTAGLNSFDFSRGCLEWLDRLQNHARYVDQDGINLASLGRVGALPRKFNLELISELGHRQPLDLDGENVRYRHLKNIPGGKVLHFNGSLKSGHWMRTWPDTLYQVRRDQQRYRMPKL